MPRYKFSSSLVLYLSITLFLALAVSISAWAGKDSPYGDILKSIQKGRGQEKKEPQTPQPPQPVPQAPQIPQLPPQTPQVTPAPQMPKLPTQVPQPTPAQPAIEAPKIPRRVYKNLPPKLKRLQDLSDEIETIWSSPSASMYFNPSETRKFCNQLDKRSNKATQLLSEVYSGKSTSNVPNDFHILLIFCKVSNAEYHTYGWHKGGSAEITHHVVGNIKLLWQAHFLIDVKNRNGHLMRFLLFPTAGKKTGDNNFAVVKYKGKVLRNLPPQTMVPIDGYDLMTGMGAYINLAPKEDYSPSLGDDPSKWPENIPTKYLLFFNMPVIGYFSSLKRQNLSTNPCDQCLQPLSLEISPERFSQAIKKGVFSLRKEDYCPSACVESEFLLEVDLPPLGCTTDKNFGPGAVAVTGNCVDHGGFILATEKEVFVNDKPVARVGDKAFCLIHGVTEIVEDKSTNVYSGKKQVARVGDKTKCGATIIGGSPDTFAGRGKP